MENVINIIKTNEKDLINNDKPSYLCFLKSLDNSSLNSAKEPSKYMLDILANSKAFWLLSTSMNT
jgi:hypothetical protein